MDPFTIALFAIGANMVGSIIKGRADQQAADLNASSLDRNAAVADQAAGDAIMRGQILAGRSLQQGAMVAAKQKTAYASAGVDTQSGSPVDVQASTGALSALDALTVKSNAIREAWGYTTQGQQFRRQAQIARMTGQNQAVGAVLGGVVGGARAAMPFLSVSGQDEPGNPAALAAAGGYDAASIYGTGI